MNRSLKPGHQAPSPGKVQRNISGMELADHKPKMLPLEY